MFSNWSSAVFEREKKRLKYKMSPPYSRSLINRDLETLNLMRSILNDRIQDLANPRDQSNY
jgi:hypothetical protein